MEFLTQILELLSKVKNKYLFLFWNRFVVLCVFTVLLTPSLAAQITVNGVTATPSTCPNNGTITVSATTTNPPLLFSIVGGPVTQPPQTGAVFSSLPTGNYTLKITDGAGNQAPASAIVGGFYQNPNFTATVAAPYCVGNTDGSITGVVSAGTGTAPFTWELMAPSPIMAAPQSSPVFNNLPSGNYTMRVTDACGGYKTSVITVPVPDTKISFHGVLRTNKVGCDSMNVQYGLRTSLDRSPFSYKYETSAGVFTYSTPTQITVGGNPTTQTYNINQILPGIDYGEIIKITVHNVCGDSIVFTAYVSPYDFFNTYGYSDCGNDVVLSFTNSNNGPPRTGFMPQLTYSFTDLATNQVVDLGSLDTQPPQDMYNTFITGFSSASVEIGKTYRVTATDGCGDVFTKDYTIPAQAPPRIVRKQCCASSCIDSVMGYSIHTEGFHNGRLIFTGGPSTFGSTKPGFAYSDTYTYPDTIPGWGDGNYGVQNLAMGKYYFKVVDDCGYEIFDSLVVTNTTNLTKDVSYKRGCLGQNNIYYGARVEATVRVRRLSPGPITILKQNNFNGSLSPNNDSITNVPAGRYEVHTEYKPNASHYPLNDNQACWVIRDTIDIPEYETPAMTSGNAIMCQDDIVFVLQPDTTKGLAPYQYEIIAGPQTFPPQASNTFNISQPGTYTVRIYDVCGNASIQHFTADTLSFEPIGSTGDCNSAQIVFPSSEYYTYHWIKPNGQAHIGNSLVINPITAADTGIYSIARVVDINGCKDTSYTTHRVRKGPYSEQTIEFCAGDTVIFNNNTYTQAGIYADTLLSHVGCDSVSVLKMEQKTFTYEHEIVYICQGDSLLIDGIYRKTPGVYHELLPPLVPGDCRHQYSTILLFTPFVTDTTDVTVCPGGSYVFGGTAYTNPGIYSDTLTSLVACDTVRVLRLSFGVIVGDSISESICAGGSYSFGGNMYTQSGIYVDTLSTLAGCDSIVTLTLDVLPYLTDTVHASICTGGSYFFGGNLYTQSGVYVDTLSSLAGCDSIVTFTLDVLPYLTDTIHASICNGGSYTFGGNVFVQSGTYTDTLTAAGGCDSIAVLVLNVLPSAQNQLTTNICMGTSYVFAGNAITQSGTYTHTFVSANGCDSVVTLILDVLPNIMRTEHASICQGGQFQAGGNVYTLPGTYTFAVPGISCDTLITLHLMVVSTLKDTVFASICENDKYTFAGIHYTQAGMYTHTFPAQPCDSLVTLNLSVLVPPRVEISTSILDNQVQLYAYSLTSPLTYLWTAYDATLSSTTSPNPLASVHKSAWIHILVTDQYGCTGTDAIQIHEPLTSSLYIPNTYTPNGDVNNEYFRVYATNLEEFEIMIFNRWGELLLETRDVNFIWDGTYMGDPVQIGMYVYKLVARGTDAVRYDHIGHITVLR